MMYVSKFNNIVLVFESMKKVVWRIICSLAHLEGVDMANKRILHAFKKLGHDRNSIHRIRHTSRTLQMLQLGH